MRRNPRKACGNDDDECAWWSWAHYEAEDLALPRRWMAATRSTARSGRAAGESGRDRADIHFTYQRIKIRECANVYRRGKLISNIKKFMNMDIA